MAKFRKRPVEVDAVQYGLGLPIAAFDINCPDWIDRAYNDGTLTNGQVDGQTKLRVRTLEGPIYASPGDWIIMGTRGEIYPCKPDVFSEVYEAVQ